MVEEPTDRHDDPERGEQKDKKAHDQPPTGPKRLTEVGVKERFGS
jgi:hypothetical protein